MMGETGMEKFIQSVEEAVEPLSPADPELGRQERIEASADEQAAEIRERAEDGPPVGTKAGVETDGDAAAVTGPGTRAGEGNKVETDAGAEALNILLVSGAQFLMNLSKAIGQPPGVQDDRTAGGDPTPLGDGVPSLSKVLQGVLGRDEATGKTYLKIPLPEAEAMSRIVSGLGQLLSGVIGTNRHR